MVYVTDEIRRGFDKYKYSSQDTSPLARYVMHPFWDFVVDFLPKWLAPNLMTFIGFLMLVANVAILAYYDFDFNASSIEKPDYPPIPNIVWLFCAIFNFLSHTLDGCDGKQARRTGSSSPVGELFDHGCDSWATLLFTLCLYSVFGRGKFGGDPIEIYYTLWLVLGMFVLSHFEKYNTGILFLPWGYDLSQLVNTALFLVTFIFGAPFFQNYAFGDYTWARLAIYLVHFGFWGLSLPHSLHNMYCAWRDGTGRNLPFLEAVRPLLSPLLLFAASSFWAHASPNNILWYHPRLFFLAVGTSCSNVACRLIIAQMSQTRCQLLNRFLLVLIPVVGVAVFSPNGVISATTEYYMLLIYTVVTILLHIHYGVCVVNEMLDHFGLRAFVIKPKNMKRGQGGAGSKHW